VDILPGNGRVKIGGRHRSNLECAGHLRGLGSAGAKESRCFGVGKKVGKGDRSRKRVRTNRKEGHMLCGGGKREGEA